MSRVGKRTGNSNLKPHFGQKTSWGKGKGKGKGGPGFLGRALEDGVGGLIRDGVQEYGRAMIGMFFNGRGKGSDKQTEWADESWQEGYAAQTVPPSKDGSKLTAETMTEQIEKGIKDGLKKTKICRRKNGRR